MKKILVTGCNGYIASGILQNIDPRIEITGIDLDPYPLNKKIHQYYQVDLKNSKDIKKVLEKLNIDVIIHLAAITDVDYCEVHPEIAYHVNTIGTQNICEIAKELQAQFIFASSASVFDGKRGNYSEQDVPNPIHIYAKTKVEAENIIKKLLDEYTICRFNLYGLSPKSQGLFNWIFTKLQKNESILAFNDVFFNPLSKNNLTDIYLELVESKFKGILHLGSPTIMTKYEFAKLIAQVFGFNEKLICAGLMDQGHLIAKRPKNTSLDIRLAKKILRTEMKDIYPELNLIKQELIN